MDADRRAPLTKPPCYLIRLDDKVLVGVESVHKAVEEDLSYGVIALLVLYVLFIVREPSGGGLQ